MRSDPCLVILLISCLGNKTNNPNVKMNYKDYERVIQGGLGWTLVGWPEGATFTAPSNFKAGGAGHIVTLWQRLKSGACRFDPMDPTLRAKIQARTSGKRSRKARGSTVKPKLAEEEPEAEETDADTDPEPAAGKKRKRQEEDAGEGSGKKSAGGEKVKRDEGKGKKKEKEKTKEKKQKGKEGSGGKKRKRGADGEQDEPPKKKKKASRPFALSSSHRSAEFVATDDDEPEGSGAGGDAVAGGSGGSGGGSAVASGSGSTGPSSWDRMQEKKAKDLRAAAEAKKRMEAKIAADIASGKITRKPKRKREPKSAKQVDEDDYNDEDSS